MSSWTAIWFLTDTDGKLSAAKMVSSSTVAVGLGFQRRLYVPLAVGAIFEVARRVWLSNGRR